jgi:hypothetical protein
MASKQLEQVLSKFAASVDMKSVYSIKDLQKMLEVSYKDVYGNKRVSSKKTGEKKTASAYNNFIKEEILKIKGEATEDGKKLDPKDYMKIAAERWREYKLKNSMDDSVSVISAV